LCERGTTTRVASPIEPARPDAVREALDALALVYMRVTIASIIAVQMRHLVLSASRVMGGPFNPEMIKIIQYSLMYITTCSVFSLTNLVLLRANARNIY
jgi:hypothetical protein